MFVTEIKTEFGFREAIKNSNQLIVVDFFATWCQPCKALHKSLEDIAKRTPSVKFYSLNVDTLHTICAKYGISRLPTLLFFRREMELDRIEGLDVDKVMRTLKKHM